MESIGLLCRKTLKYAVKPSVQSLTGTVAQLVRALAFSAEGPRIEICREPKKNIS